MHTEEFFEEGQIRYPDSRTNEESHTHVRNIVSLRRIWETALKRSALIHQRSIVQNVAIHPLLTFNEKHTDASEALFHLCERLLQLNPSYRFSARQAQDHPFIQSSHPAELIPSILP